MVHNIFQDFLFPSRLKPKTYGRGFDLNAVKSQDERLSLDMKTLDAMLLTSSLIDSDMMEYSVRQSRLPFTANAGDQRICLHDFVHDIAQRFFLERDDAATRRFLRSQSYVKHRKGTMEDRHACRSQQTPLQPSESQHLKAYEPTRRAYHTHFLHTGPDAFTAAGHFNPMVMPDTTVYINPDMQRSTRDMNRSARGLDILARARGPVRTRSEPPPNSHSAAYMALFTDIRKRSSCIMWPTLSLQDLDHRTRRRSLSRRHIARMFLKAPLYEMQFRVRGHYSEQVKGQPRCSNCSVTGHTDEECVFPCGHCGSFEHDAVECPVPKSKRCKCSPFPTFHQATKCHVRCSRHCGNTWPPGHHKHKNAMCCKARCCMCGLKGHAGVDCNLKKCRCGDIHLGQNCTWKPECRVQGCYRYLCGVHCRECGSKERPFVGWRCQACLKNGKPASPKEAGAEAEAGSTLPFRPVEGVYKDARMVAAEKIDLWITGPLTFSWGSVTPYM